MKDEGQTTAQGIVIYDGSCRLCHISTTFLQARDKQHRLRLLPAQAPEARKWIDQYHLQAQVTQTVLLIENGLVYTRSTALLRMLTYLGWPWKAARALVVIPRFLRDFIYDKIAQHRYRLFGTCDSCQAPGRPTPDTEK